MAAYSNNKKIYTISHGLKLVVKCPNKNTCEKHNETLEKILYWEKTAAVITNIGQCV